VVGVFKKHGLAKVAVSYYARRLGGQTEPIHL